MAEVIVPHMFHARPYQTGIFKARDRGIRRILCVWHRRAGKDKSLLNLTVREAVRRVGAYYYYFPTAVWARRVIWQGMDRDGFPFVKHIPDILVKKVHDREMMVEFANGSIFQIIGTDTLDIVGMNPIGCVFSEYSLQNPKAWQFVTPILAENEGWAAFNFTPRGKNHAYKLFKLAQRLPEWYCELLTIEDTGAINPDYVKKEIENGVISKELAEQEYYCSFDYGMEGSIFGDYVRKAHADKRVGKFPYDPERRVMTFWDLGVYDAMSVWFGQYYPDQHRIFMIEHMEESNKGLDWFKAEMDKRPYRYGGHFAPHDASKRDHAFGLSTVQHAAKLGIDFTVVPRTAAVEADIELCRRLFRNFCFDEDKCDHGLICLNDWHRSETTGKPEHDWTSHAVDAFRTACRAYELGLVKHAERDWEIKIGKRKRQSRTISEYDPLDEGRAVRGRGLQVSAGELLY